MDSLDPNEVSVTISKVENLNLQELPPKSFQLEEDYKFTNPFKGDMVLKSNEMPPEII
jgi:hypothetical protein